MKPTFFGATIVALALFFTIPTAQAGSCSSGHAGAEASTASAGSDIVDTAVSAGSFETLVAAVKAAGLVDVLKGDGPFTVFAPTDDAFADLPRGTVESLLEPRNRQKLIDVLTYHVVSGEVPSAVAVTLAAGATVNGQRLDIDYDGSTLRIDDATVVQADVETSNGVIHVIDRVLMPETDDILAVAEAAGSFETLAAALGAADLVDALGGEGPFTVFAPTDEAFEALPAGTVESLLKPENRDRLVGILKYHVVAGRVYADQALAAASAQTLQGGAVDIGIRDGAARVNEARLVKTDIEATNGVIHVIDRVLLPETAVRTSSAATRLIERAIERGAPLFNRGNVAACAGIYMTAADGLVALDDVPASSKRTLDAALRRADRTHDSRDQAWILRDALDTVYEDLRDMETARR